MDIRVLNYFLTVAREGSMTGAARILHVSQPTLSKQLKNLEEELGRKLFNRTNYSIKLTNDGMLLRKRAEDLIELFEKTQQEFENLDEESGGDVYIGSAETDAFRYFACSMMDLKERYPDMKYHLTSGNSFDVTERLDRGMDDFAIVVDPIDLSKYNYITFPATDVWGIVMHKDSELAKKESIAVSDLVNLPLIVSKQAIQTDISKNQFAEWFGETLDRLKIVGTYSLPFNAFIMAREGFGNVLAFEKMINVATENDLVFRPLEPQVECKLYVIWKKYQVFSPAANLFLESIQKKLQSSSTSQS
ncbi:LysR family transcriptional regulator [Enterococcus sp. AZ109]|uniref:LysR family transcriptional regulator n=1 Tax=Enterococcus sp. AZ109 TaxID=2774634 RepID=UPI003F20FCB8